MCKLEAEAINKHIDQIRLDSHSDFAALALSHHNERACEWYYASGNTNDRYKRMIVRPGKGLPGTVLQIGRMLAINQYPTGGNGLKVECPIMLAESLKSAAAVPIRQNAMNIGVLMIGNRQVYPYSALELQALQAGMEGLAAMIHYMIGS